MNATKEEKPDAELEALHACLTSLAKLTADARRRVLEYLQQRFSEDA